MRPPSSGEPLLAELREDNHRLETLVKKQELDFKTLFEMANAINERSLDPRGIEAYLIYICNAVRGQFGANKVYVMREIFENEPRRYAVLDKGKTLFECPRDCAFTRFLTKARGALPLASPDMEGMPEVKALRTLDVETLAPLLRFQEGKPELKGVLAIGKRLVKAPFAAGDLQMFGLLGSIIAISLHNAELHRKAIVDNLTQVYSRGHFDLSLDAEISRAERYGGQHHSDEVRFVSLLMMDIDHFKKINDSYGHQVGDAVLRMVARAMKGTVRKSDVVARYGGEEFALIAPETNKEEAIRMAERLRTRIMESKIEGPGGKPVSVTASFGVATYPNDAGDLRSLVAAADKALYQAKERGRNQVVSVPSREHS
ncbi:MAG: GGDEF domain-containing protein [Planctomycetes bacterium]|nr:GGDEF domain-containing protein [Planctomycetota bacterium]